MRAYFTTFAAFVLVTIGVPFAAEAGFVYQEHSGSAFAEGWTGSGDNYAVDSFTAPPTSGNIYTYEEYYAEVAAVVPSVWGYSHRANGILERAKSSERVAISGSAHSRIWGNGPLPGHGEATLSLTTTLTAPVEDVEVFYSIFVTGTDDVDVTGSLRVGNVDTAETYLALDETDQTFNGYLNITVPEGTRIIVEMDLQVVMERTSTETASTGGIVAEIAFSPEPSSAVLLGLGMTVILRRRRNSRRAPQAAAVGALALPQAR
ncbi:MAG: PEP-CTERM sorting domain-containing protein [Phycisphaerales bacterium]|nr:PEP-CTERM sorting domain-containing protein [Phycisphaerales bacterium]